MVTTQRASRSLERVDMCVFLSANDEFMDLRQCIKLETSKIAADILSNVLVGALNKADYDIDHQISEVFSVNMGNNEETQDAA